MDKKAILIHGYTSSPQKRMIPGRGPGHNPYRQSPMGETI